MNYLKRIIRDWLINLSSRKSLKSLKKTLALPIAANSIGKILVILPRNLTEIENATNFVYFLRRDYPAWKIDIFDVDKISGEDLNFLGIPRSRILKKIQQQEYDLIINLNPDADSLINYFTIQSGAPYRLHLNDFQNPYYNITYHTESPSEDDYASLKTYIQKIFVRDEYENISLS